MDRTIVVLVVSLSWSIWKDSGSCKHLSGTGDAVSNGAVMPHSLIWYTHWILTDPIQILHTQSVQVTHKCL